MRSHFFGLSLGLVLLGCSSTAATTTTITRPELVEVSPDDFMGTLHCDDTVDAGVTMGLVGSYVATFYDVTTQGDGGPAVDNFPLPSSPATRCEFPVTFTRVLDDHRYRALIEAYDRQPQVEEPDGGPDPETSHITAVSVGGRLQQDGNGVPVAPRWTALCGGYPPTDLDAGSATASSAGGGAGGDTGMTGVTSYSELTTSVHDCPHGLQPVDK